jgi:hypothetical protein
MPESTPHDPLSRFGVNCCLCIHPRPVHKDGMCVSHYAEFGSKAWKEGGATKKGIGFRLTPLHKDGPRKPKTRRDANAST